MEVVLSSKTGQLFPSARGVQVEDGGVSDVAWHWQGATRCRPVRCPPFLPSGPKSPLSGMARKDSLPICSGSCIEYPDIRIYATDEKVSDRLRKFSFRALIKEFENPRCSS
jgi:hypothetical protein